MQRTPARWTLIPVALGGLFVAACSLLLILNLLTLAAHPGHPIKLARALFGVVRAPDPPTGWPAIANGRLQATVAQEIGTLMPLYPAAVRLRNDLAYRLFDASANPDIVVVRDHALLQWPYVNDYCSRDIAAFLPGARIWVRQIREMQDLTERRGRTFVYVLTPSKLAQYPSLLPASLPCRSSQSDRLGLVPAWLALLRDAGVHVVDTTAIVRAAHATTPLPLYPRSGIHWNWIGAALATQAVLAEVDRLRGSQALVPFGFTWRAAPPDATDTDLALLLNLSHVPDRAPTPSLTLAPGPAPAPCPALRVATVGGSFLVRIGALLSGTACRPTVNGYQYWQSIHLHWSGVDARSQGPVDPTERAATVRAADVLIYEENEALLGHARHGAALHDFLAMPEHERVSP